MLHALLIAAAIFFCTVPFTKTAYALQETPTVHTAPPEKMEPPEEEPAPPANATEIERYTLSHDRYQKAVAYSRAGYTLYFVSIFVGFAVLILMLRFGWVTRIRDFAQRTTENRFLQGLLFVPVLLLILELADLPAHLGWHALSLHYQQSVQGWGSWLLDWTKSEVIIIVFLTVMGLLLFFVMRFSPRRWWLYFWLAALPIILVTFFLKPVVIDPLFFRFEPLATKQPQMASELFQLTRRAGLNIPTERMFLMNASSKTNEMNAYVTGFGASKRVVIYDTLVQKMTRPEAAFVFGHEAGHYVLHHVRDGFLFLSGSLLLAFYITYRLLGAWLNRWGEGWKIYGPQDWAALAVLFFILEALTFVSMPVVNGFSRVQEHNADIFGLELIHGIVPNSSQVAAHAFQVMGELDLADPNPPPFVTFWLYSHPPLADRLVFAHGYDPWGKRQRPKYFQSQR